MKSTVIFLLLSFLLTACGRHASPEDNSPDGQLRKKLIGTWTMEKWVYPSSHVDTNVPRDSRLLLSADGNFKFQATTRGSNHVQNFIYAGKWLVTNGEVQTTATSSSHPDAVHVGSTNLLKVTSIDSNEFSWFDDSDSDQMIYYKRLDPR